MDSKELKIILQNTLERFLFETLSERGFKWKKSSLRFQRKKDDFEQSILFFWAQPKYNDDNSIGHLNVMIRLDSNDVNTVASNLKGSTTKFDDVDTVVNVDTGLIVGSNAISWRPSSIHDLNKIIETKIKPLITEDIIPFFDKRNKLQELLKDFETKEKYFFWTSNGEVALRAIAMYSMVGKTELAKKAAEEYYLKDKSYKVLYKHVLNHFSLL